MKNVKWYGWKRNSLDHRDFVYSYKRTKLPTSFSLMPYCPPVYDQGALGSCTANAAAGELEIYQHISGAVPDFYFPSRLFVYYNTRSIEGTVSYDSGATIRDTIKSLAKYGACEEGLWKYQIKKYKTKPAINCYKQANTNLVDRYENVPQSARSIKTAISMGFPVIYGFTVFESFESDQVAKTGIVPMPSKSEAILGGHATLLVGYDDNSQRFLVRNSWGSSWGMKGYFTIPYRYIFDPKLASDFWIIRHAF